MIWQKCTRHLAIFRKSLNEFALKARILDPPKPYVAKGGGEGDDPPPLAIVVLLWSPLLAWKIVPPLRVKKVGLYPPKHFEYPYPWTPPRRPRPKKNFLPLRGKSELYFWQPQYKEPWKLSKKHKKLKKKFISGKLPPSLFDLVRVPTLSPPQ